MTTTPTQRVAALRQRRKDAGLVRVEYYLTKPQAEKVKALISKLTKEQHAAHGPQARQTLSIPHGQGDVLPRQLQAGKPHALRAGWACCRQRHGYP